jgi:epoxyqueuosine reductase QueG
MDNLNEIIMDAQWTSGACAVGVATRETLAGGPPSADLTYVLPEAKSAIVFGFGLDQELIGRYLRKEDRRPHERNNIEVNMMSSGAALFGAKFLEELGYPSYAVCANTVYRKDAPGGSAAMMPDISLRYLAVASGIAHFGLSGNVITKNEGAGIILGAIVTTAELEPTPPLPVEENYCDNCKLCMTSCASSLMDPDGEERVTLGGKEYTYSKRRTYHRCDFVCGGFTGLHPSGTWSTWSPGRFLIPDAEEEFYPALAKAVQASTGRPQIEGGYRHPHLPDRRIALTCGNCHLICVADKQERAKRYKALRESGCVVQNPDGTLEAVPAEEATERLAAMDKERRLMYESF